MTTNESTAEKRIVEKLNFGPKTARRVAWEAWEFTVVGPHQVEVTNASYGVEKDEHAYVVGVEERDDVVVPAECECPADIHREPDCKHKVALATVGSSTVLEAAVAFDSAAASSNYNTERATTVAEALRTDGGTADITSLSEPETCPNGAEWCPGADGDDLSCFDCYRGEN